MTKCQICGYEIKGKISKLNISRDEAAFMGLPYKIGKYEIHTCTRCKEKQYGSTAETGRF